MRLSSISVVIPAANEEHYLGTCIQALRNQSYPPIEIIVVVNGARDRTPDIARALADKVLEFKQLKGYCFPKNQGARLAAGEVILFVDADTVLSKNTLQAIASIARPMTFGTTWAAEDVTNPGYHLYYLVRNLVHKSGIHKGMLGCMFSDRALFEKVGGFNEKITVGEYYDFAKRATAVGAKYVVCEKAIARVSTRRFERRGFWRTIWFWITAGPRIMWAFGKRVSRREYPALRPTRKKLV